MKKIEKVGIIGFGVMGAAIALNASASGFTVVFKELNDELVAEMYDKWVTKALGKRVELGKMTRKEMDEVSGRISGSSDFGALADCDLVIEAAVENISLKKEIFADVAKVIRDDAILVSNTSTYLIETLMADVPHQERTAGLHYFFPANVNRLVEVIRQKNTGKETYEALMNYAAKCEKVAITVTDFPGFAINPVFISSYLVLNAFYGDDYNAATLDDLSKEALGVKYGIMWVQNGSGLGTAYHAAVSMQDYLGDSDMGFPPVPGQLKRFFEAGKLWDLEDGPVATDPAVRQKVIDRLRGTIFAVVTHLIEKQVVSVKDLELGICTALAWPKGPFALMNSMGMEGAAALVKDAVDAGMIKMPKTFAEGIPAAWEL
jgi:3-hydroxyacyl-CoA dehydrogenase